jgi:hypothetical protein
MDLGIRPEAAATWHEPLRTTQSVGRADTPARALGPLRVAIYDVSGRLVRVVCDEPAAAAVTTITSSTDADLTATPFVGRSLLSGGSGRGRRARPVHHPQRGAMRPVTLRHGARRMVVLMGMALARARCRRARSPGRQARARVPFIRPLSSIEPTGSRSRTSTCRWATTARSRAQCRARDSSTREGAATTRFTPPGRGSVGWSRAISDSQSANTERVSGPMVAGGYLPDVPEFRNYTITRQ